MHLWRGGSRARAFVKEYKNKGQRDTDVWNLVQKGDKALAEVVRNKHGSRPLAELWNSGHGMQHAEMHERIAKEIEEALNRINAGRSARRRSAFGPLRLQQDRRIKQPS